MSRGGAGGEEEKRGEVVLLQGLREVEGAGSSGRRKRMFSDSPSNAAVFRRAFVTHQTFDRLL